MEQSEEEEFVSTIRALCTGHGLLTPNKNEELLLNKLQGLVTNVTWSREDACRLFDCLQKRFKSTADDSSQLLSWLLEMLHCVEINYITPSWRCQTDQSVFELVQDNNITDENLKKYLAGNTEKTLEEIIEEIRQQELNQIDETLLKDVADVVSSVSKALTHNDGSRCSGLKKDLLRLCQAAERTHFRPRLTQMVSWCVMVLSKTGLLIQVGTGEGKSCIVAMFAAFQAMKGKKVDIMSSSSVLAERDIKEWEKFFKVLKISVSCNTNKNVQDLKKCYECQVVYGTVEQFAGVWLQQHFNRMDIIGKREFQCAIVDEADSLMLDKGHHVVYIGSEMPALQHLNPVLAFIWATVNQYTKINKTTVGRKYPFPQVVLDQLTNREDMDEVTILQMAEDTGILAKGSARHLQENPNLLPRKTASVTASQLAKFFKTVEEIFPTCKFALHRMNDDGSIEEMNNGTQTETDDRRRVPLLLIDGGFCQYMYANKTSKLEATEAEVRKVLRFTPCEVSKDSNLYIPGFLSDLVNAKLKDWITNAFYAQTMTNDHEYIVERHGVVPVDYSCTGVVENNMKWGDGLHQFLEMKHKRKLSDMTAITNYMSNVGLLQKYGDQIFGISGTLGKKAETETLQGIYKGIKTCQIPSFKRKKLFEVEGVIVDDEEEWIEKICKVVTEQTHPTPYRDQRAALVICETISRAKVLHEALGDTVPNKKLYISNNVDNSATIAKQLDRGEVIIATNLAGRGTDIQVSEKVKTAGGLLVVQTFLPQNARVEAQAFGRTARQGSPGSAQLIVCSDHLPAPLQVYTKLQHVLVLTRELRSVLEADITPLYRDLFVMQLRAYQFTNSDELDLSSTLSSILTEKPDSGIQSVKKIRDEEVAEGLASYLKCDIPKMKKKEALFCQYLDFRDEVYRSSNDKPADSYLSGLNEFWGMWLLIKVDENQSLEDLKYKLNEDLKTARLKLQRRESPSSNLHHYTCLGNELREKDLLAESIKMYTKAIQEDHCWAAIAYYNRALASLSVKDRPQDPTCIDGALEDLQSARKSVELYCKQVEDTHTLEDVRTDSLTRFDNHMTARYRVLLFFRENINNAIQKVSRARDIGGKVKVQEIPVIFLVPAVHLLPLVVLSITSLRSNSSRDPLRIQQLINDPSFDTISEVSFLQSLGLTHVYTLDTLFSLGGFFSTLHRRLFQA